MLLNTAIIIIAVLFISLIAFFIEEIRARKARISMGSVKEYWDGKERRQCIRIDVSLPVRYTVIKKQNMKLNGRTKDVSKSGMRLVVNEKFTNGTLLLLEFDLPNIKKAINVEGRVIWADGEFYDRNGVGRRVFQTGIQFTDIKPDIEYGIDKYITQIAEKT